MSEPRVAGAYEYIRNQIISGNYAIEVNMPSRLAIATDLDMSVGTLHGAYEVLQAEGFITRSGRGTMVASAEFWPEAARRPEHTGQCGSCKRGDHKNCVGGTCKCGCH